MKDGWLSVRPSSRHGADDGQPSGRTARARLPRITIDFGEHDIRPFTASGAELVADLEVVDVLGEGGMGQVLLARQHALDREVAVKTVKEGADDQDRRALLAEGLISGGLEHPGIVPIHAMGVDVSGRPVLVMKRVEGVSWDVLLDDPQHPAWRHWAGSRDDSLLRNLEIFMQLCNAVHFAHSRGILHRDIKPHNVLIGRYGDVYLADWGVATQLASLPKSAPFAGTPVYAAPEMVSGKGLSVQTDVYLLGSTLHHILTGEPRHAADSAREALAWAVLSKPYDYQDNVPPELGQIVNVATHRDQAKRPQSAEELRASVADYLKHRSSTLVARSAAERLNELNELDGLASAQDAAPEIGAQIDALAARTRFGFSEALNLWDGNEQARAALAQLDVLMDRRAERAIKLEQLAQDFDPTRSHRQRSAMYLMIGALTLLVSPYGVYRALHGEPWTPTELVDHAVLLIAVVLVCQAALRRSLKRSAINRKAGIMVLAAVSFIAVARIIGWLGGVSTAQMLVTDCLILAANSLTGSLVMSRWFALPAAMMVLLALICQLWPQHSTLFFSLITIPAALGAAIVAARKGTPAGETAR